MYTLMNYLIIYFLFNNSAILYIIIYYDERFMSPNAYLLKCIDFKISQLIDQFQNRFIYYLKYFYHNKLINFIKINIINIKNIKINLNNIS